MFRENIEQLDKLPQKVIANTLEISVKNPIIAIISAQSQFSVSNNNLSDLATRVEKGIIEKGATPVHLNLSVCDSMSTYGSFSNKYDLPIRDLIADNVEMLLSGDNYDAVVFVTNLPNVSAGMLLGAIRLNVPCLFVFGGIMSPIVFDNAEHGLVEVFRQISKIKTGKTAYETLGDIEKNTPLVCGNDCERYGQNSFNCLLEALGFAVKGCSTATANSREIKEMAHSSGKAAVYMAEDKLTPRRLITQQTLQDSVVFDLACGGSSTTMLNVLYVAREMGFKNITLKTIGDLGKTTPVLLATNLMNVFHKAGGVYGVIKQLQNAKLIKTDYCIYNNEQMSTQLDEEIDETVIRPHDNAVNSSAFLRVVYGNVANDGCFLQHRGEGNFTGVAKVYNNEQFAIDALLHREIRAGDVVVIKNEGPKSGPGMSEIFMTFALLSGMGLSDKVAVITDGRIADIYEGVAVGHVTPETGEGEVFDVLQDGDEIEISLTKGKVNCDIKAKELQTRVKNLDNGTQGYANHFLKNWSKTVSSASEGCYVKAIKK